MPSPLQPLTRRSGRCYNDFTQFCNSRLHSTQRCWWSTRKDPYVRFDDRCPAPGGPARPPTGSTARRSRCRRRPTGGTVGGVPGRAAPAVGVQHPVAGPGRRGAGAQHGPDGRLVRRARGRARAARQDHDGAGRCGGGSWTPEPGGSPWPPGRSCGWRVAAGVPRVQLANALVDPVALARLAGLLDADPELDVLSWVDSVDTVAAMEAALAAAPTPARPLDRAGRAGRARRPHRGPRPGHRAAPSPTPSAAAPHLQLGGVAGYEGALAHDAAPGRAGAVRGYLRELAALHAALRDAGALPRAGRGHRGRQRLLRRRGRRARPRWPTADTTVLLRSGAYLIHDDGFYRGISPLSRPGADRRAVPLGHARLGPGGLPARAGAGPAGRGQAGRPVRRGAAGAAAGRRPARGRRPGHWPARSPR